MKVGRNGEPLACKLVNERKIVVVNVPRRKRMETLKVSNKEILYACGGNLMVTCDRARNELTRYSLSTGTKQASSTLAVPGVPVAMEMGANNDDIALMRIAAGTSSLDRVSYFILDVSRLRLTKMKKEPRNDSFRDWKHIRLSADGRAMTA